MGKKITLSLLVMMLLFFPLVTFAYSVTGISWFRAPFTIATVDIDPATNRSLAEESAIWTSMSEWSNAGAEFYYVDTTTSGHDFRNYYDSDTATLAIAYTSWIMGYYNNLYVSVNTAKTWATNGSAYAYDFQSMAIHELGHGLGLSHSSNSDATMYSSMGLGETKKRSLHSDDVSGIQFIY